MLLTARPATATSSGSPAATTEPNVMQQDQRCGREADALRPDLRGLPARHRLAAERDLEALVIGLLGDSDELLGVLDRDVVGVDHVEAGLGVQRAAVRRDATVPACGVGVVDGSHVRYVAQLGQQRLDVGPGSRVVDPLGAPRGEHDDVDDVTRLRGEARLEQVLGLAGVRARGGVVGVEVAAEGRGQADGQEQGAQPAEHDAAAAAERDVGEPAQGTGPTGGRDRPRRGRRPAIGAGGRGIAGAGVRGGAAGHGGTSAARIGTMTSNAS